MRRLLAALHLGYCKFGVNVALLVVVPLVAMTGITCGRVSARIEIVMAFVTEVPAEIPLEEARINIVFFVRTLCEGTVASAVLAGSLFAEAATVLSSPTENWQANNAPASSNNLCANFMTSPSRFL